MFLSKIEENSMEIACKTNKMKPLVRCYEHNYRKLTAWLQHENLRLCLQLDIYRTTFVWHSSTWKIHTAPFTGFKQLYSFHSFPVLSVASLNRRLAARRCIKFPRLNFATPFSILLRFRGRVSCRSLAACL
jgi:hypothetical protein